MISIKDERSVITCDNCKIVLLDNVDVNKLKYICSSTLCKECETKLMLNEVSKVQRRED